MTDLMNQIPFWEAVCNGISLVFMCAAIVAIKNGKRELHGKLMATAIAFSAVFLALYLYYHFTHDSVKYAGEFGTIYYPILISHIILAALVPFLVGFVVWKAYKSEFQIHKKYAKWTFPIWAYVSLTGIIVYYMVHVP